MTESGYSYGVERGFPDGQPTVYLARFKDGARINCCHLSPDEAAELGRRLMQAADRLRNDKNAKLWRNDDR